MLTVVLSNLIRNAIHYAREGPREHRVLVRATSAPPGVRFEVDDTGPGLEPGTEARIFEPFVRLGDGGGGIGLGLATVKRLVAAHGGRVGVRSSPGRGCCFWFELPAA
jgi:signal transduction histidine kinase